MNRTFGITNDYIGNRDANVWIVANASKQFCNRGPRRSRAVDHDLHLLKRLSNNTTGVDQGCKQNDRGSMLVVVKNRNPKILQRVFDFETSWG